MSRMAITSPTFKNVLVYLPVAVLGLLARRLSLVLVSRAAL